MRKYSDVKLLKAFIRRRIECLCLQCFRRKEDVFFLTSLVYYVFIVKPALSGHLFKQNLFTSKKVTV